MAKNVVIKDNSKAVLSALEKRIKLALNALGRTVVETAQNYMIAKYYQPAYDTGDLLRSIKFGVSLQHKTVTIGTNIEYAPWVHNGTSLMEARPFLRDAVMENMDVWREIITKYLGAGWGVGVDRSLSTFGVSSAYGYM